MYIKHLHKFSPQNTLQERNLPNICQAGKNTKQTQFHKTYVPEGTNQRAEFTRRSCGGRDEIMQNEPNLKTYMPQGIKLMYLKEIVMCLKAPKRTQFENIRT
jgi:hypothetical protein